MQHTEESRTFAVEEAKLRELVDLPDGWAVQHASRSVVYPEGSRGEGAVKVLEIRFHRYVRSPDQTPDHSSASAAEHTR
jgi:hypothetical protein